MAVNIYKKKLKEQVKTLYFKTDLNVLKELMIEFEDFEKMLKHLRSIDIENVKPMTRVDETPILSLREDIPQTNDDYSLLLKNTVKTKDNYIVLNNMDNHD